MTTALERFFVHEVIVERNPGPYGTAGATETLLGFVRDGSKLVLGPNGENVVSTAQVTLPAGTAYVPPKSRVTLPAQFGGRVCTVITTQVADGGGLPTPDHMTLVLA